MIEIFNCFRKENIKIALASSSSKKNKYYFDLIVSGQEVKRGKPFPDIYQFVMKDLNINFEDTIVTEDSEIGIKAGESARCIVIAYQNQRFEQNQELVDKYIISFNDLINTIKVL